jgi:hypothetical protein
MTISPINAVLRGPPSVFSPSSAILHAQSVGDGRLR